MRTGATRAVVTGVMLSGFLMAGIAGTTAQSASSCPLPPLELPLFDATPAAQIAEATPAIVSAPSEREIVAAAEVIVACISTNDASYRYAVFTDRYLASQFTENGGAYQPEFELMIAQRSSDGDAKFALDAVEGISPRADGRVEVVLRLTGPDSELADRLILARQGDFWLIDEIVELDPPR